MSLLTISILIVLALVLIILEIFVVPGVTVFGVGGFILLGVSIYYSFVDHGTSVGVIVALMTFLILILFLYTLSKRSVRKRIALNEKITAKVNIIEGITEGDCGRTISRLAPSGKILVNDTIFEASSISEFIDEERDVEIVSVDHNKIIVKLK